MEYLLKQVKKGRMSLEEAAERLLEYDQLEVERAKGRVFKGFSEGTIHFQPTFKVRDRARYCPQATDVMIMTVLCLFYVQYNKGRESFDSSSKRRVPAYTDRVLFKPCNDSVEVLSYDSIPACKHSDHRPVYARFRVKLAPIAAAAQAVDSSLVRSASKRPPPPSVEEE